MVKLIGVFLDPKRRIQAPCGHGSILPAIRTLAFSPLLATRQSIADSVRNTMVIVERECFKSVAFPLIGSGSGNRGREFSLSVMLETFAQIECSADVVIVQYRKA